MEVFVYSLKMCTKCNVSLFLKKLNAHFRSLQLKDDKDSGWLQKKHSSHGYCKQNDIILYHVLDILHFSCILLKCFQCLNPSIKICEFVVFMIDIHVLWHIPVICMGAHCKYALNPMICICHVGIQRHELPKDLSDGSDLLILLNKNKLSNNMGNAPTMSFNETLIEC